MPAPGKYALLPFLLCWLCGCANITPPTGGEKDITAPKLVKTVPAQKSTNYAGKVVVLEFDERIDAKNLQTELLIAPITTNTYKQDINKNVLTLEFEQNLAPNTTYTLNFRNSIEDITERNKAIQPTLTFSTGPYLDSGTVAGTVKQLLTNKPEADINVLLYRLADTGSIRTTLPYYTTLTDGSGHYRFEHLVPGDYKLFALADKNNNLLYDQEKERVAFLTKPITVTNALTQQPLATVSFDTQPPILLSRKEEADKLRLIYNEGLSNFTLSSLRPTAETVVYWLQEGKKEAWVFPLDNQRQLSLLVTATDSAGRAKTDTVRASLPEGVKLRHVSFKPNKSQLLRQDTLILTYPRPLQTLQTPAISLALDSLPPVTLPLSDYRLDITQHQIVLPLNLRKGITSITIKTDSSALKDFTGLAVRAQQEKFDILEEARETGEVSGVLKTTIANPLLQLVNDKFQLIQQVRTGGTFRFADLTPGSYQLRVVADDNRNGTWDAGTPDFSSLPEEIYFHPETLDIRANWQLDRVVVNTVQTIVDKPAK